MDDDDDFLPATQLSRRMSQYSAARPSTSRTVSGSQSQPRLSSRQSAFVSQGPASHVVTAEASPTSQPLSLSQNHVAMVLELLQNIQDRGAKLKPVDKKPDQKQKFKCAFDTCKSVLCNITNLFRHYERVHKIKDPERLHNCTIDSNVVNLDDSIVKHKCVYCGHESRDANALDVHIATSHSIVEDFNQNKTLNLNESTVTEVRKDKMLKCDECSAYFEDKAKLDEHQKKHHSYEAECKICNKNFLFKDFDVHVRSSHPEVYGEKEEGKKEQVIVKKTQRLKSGKVRFVFNCDKCGEKFLEEDKANKHARAHAKGLKTRVIRCNKRVGDKGCNRSIPPQENNILFICETCKIATASCDSVIQHSQNHITNPNTTVKGHTCDVCLFKFEPACYEQHLDRHYRDKELGKESFSTQTYKYHLIFSNDWTAAFTMADAEVKKIFSKSIYAHTRTVVMRVVSVTETTDNVFNLYKCGQCDTFVDPASVANHTSNYNTCVKITKNFACTVCHRNFNSKLARDSHHKLHKGKENFKIVAFNATRDREVNKVLNDSNIMINILNPGNQGSDAEELNKNERNSVIYKCTCGLCFVSKEKSENHSKVCLRYDPIENCPKCDALFNLSELENHLKQHTIGAPKFAKMDIINEPIVIDSDDDDNDSRNGNNSMENENRRSVKIEPLHTDINISSVSVIEVLDSDDEVDSQRSNTVEVSTDKQINKDGAVPLPVTTTVDIDVCMSESDNQTEDLEDNHDDLNSDNDSQDTINYEEPLNVNACEIFNTNNALKCVPTNLLLNPVNIDCGSISPIEKVINDVGGEIEAVTRHIEMTGPVIVKQERSWSCASITKRPPLRQINLPISSNIDLITDDEDEMSLPIIPANEQTENNDVDEDNDSDTLLTLSGHTATENVDEVNDTPCNAVIAYNHSFSITGNAAMEVQRETESETLEENNEDVNEDENVTRNAVEMNHEIHEWNDLVVRRNLISNNTFLIGSSDQSSLFEKHAIELNHKENSIETIIANNGEQTDQINQICVVENRIPFNNHMPLNNVINSNQIGVALVVPDVLINIDNIKKELIESKIKSKLIHSSNIDIENSDIEVKREHNNFDDKRRSGHRQALGWPTSVITPSISDSSMVTFQNMPSNDGRNASNYNLNILMSDRNGSMKESNNNCSIC